MLEGPRGDELDCFPPLTLDSLHSFSPAESLGAGGKLEVDVSDVILEYAHLFHLVTQLLLQLQNWWTSAFRLSSLRWTISSSTQSLPL